MVGRLPSFWKGPFSGANCSFQEVHLSNRSFAIEWKRIACLGEGGNGSDLQDIGGNEKHCWGGNCDRPAEMRWSPGLLL